VKFLETTANRYGTGWIKHNYPMVNLMTTQVETIFGEIEYIEPRLKALEVK
jgi:hypothetical protein